MFVITVSDSDRVNEYIQLRAIVNKTKQNKICIERVLGVKVSSGSPRPGYARCKNISNRIQPKEEGTHRLRSEYRALDKTICRLPVFIHEVSNNG